MESTVSVSKGVFLLPNGFKNTKESKKRNKRNLFDSLFINDPWYSTFKHNWEQIENQIIEFHKNTYSGLVNDIVHYVKTLEHNQGNNQEGIIPSATLLTGVNQPDHVNQFITLVNIIREEVTPHVSIINSQDAHTLKNLVENAVWQLIKGQDVLV